jgi:uncharacterized protein
MSQETNADRPSWREVVREAAHQAAVRETRARQEGREILFNYRWEHVQSVARGAVRLAEILGADLEVVEAAAWLHDVAKGQGEDHGAEGAIRAEQILGQTDFAQDKVAAVCDAIAKHVGLWVREPVEPLEAAIVWDADKLAKVGATSLLHFTGYFFGGGPCTTAHLIERMKDTEWQERTLESFHTAPAQEAGKRRLALFQTFIQAAEAEQEARDL